MHQQPPYGNGYWGLGISVSGDGDSLAFSHGGRDEGFVADMFMRPGSGRGFVIMMNGVAGGIMAEIERAFAEEYGFGAPPRSTRTAVSMPASKLAEYAGRYVAVVNADTLRFDVTVARDGKTLDVYNPAARRSLPIAPVGGDMFVGLEGGGAWDFERTGANGPVRAIASGTGPNRRVLTKQ
jgi:hypothetical protein